MRLFIAVDLDDEEYFRQIQKQIPKAKATFPKAFHLTLKFLGETDKKDEVINALEKITFKQFKLRTTNIGVFPSENYIRVVWLGLEYSNELKKLQEEIEKSLEKFKFKKDHEFTPHITLARIKFIKKEDKKDFAKQIKQIKFLKKEFDIKEFRLIKSELAKEGPVYETIKEFRAK